MGRLFGDITRIRSSIGRGAWGMGWLCLLMTLQGGWQRVSAQSSAGAAAARTRGSTILGDGADGDRAACEQRLFQVATLLEERRFAELGRFAREQLGICPEGVGAYVGGLADGNLALRPGGGGPRAASTVPSRAALRGSALAQLYTALDHPANLPPPWVHNARRWVERLEAEHRTAVVRARVETGRAEASLETGSNDSPPVATAEPPEALWKGAHTATQPVPASFPLGPLLVGSISGVALVGALVLSITAEQRFGEAKVRFDILAAHAEQPGDGRAAESARDARLGLQADNQGKALRRWAIGVGAVGAVAACVALGWYGLGAPENGWGWAIGGDGVKLRGTL